MPINLFLYFKSAKSVQQEQHKTYQDHSKANKTSSVLTRNCNHSIIATTRMEHDTTSTVNSKDKKRRGAWWRALLPSALSSSSSVEDDHEEEGAYDGDESSGDTDMSSSPLGLDRFFSFGFGEDIETLKAELGLSVDLPSPIYMSSNMNPQQQQMSSPYRQTDEDGDRGGPRYNNDRRGNHRNNNRDNSSHLLLTSGGSRGGAMTQRRMSPTLGRGFDDRPIPDQSIFSPTNSNTNRKNAYC